MSSRLPKQASLALRLAVGLPLILVAVAAVVALLAGCAGPPPEAVEAGQGTPVSTAPAPELPEESAEGGGDRAAVASTPSAPISTTTTTVQPTPTVTIPGDDGRVRACVEKVAEVLDEHGYTVLVELEMAVMAALFATFDPATVAADFAVQRDLWEAQCVANTVTGKLTVLQTEVPVP